MDATGPNAEQITYWNEQTGQKWAGRQSQLDRQLTRFGAAAMDALQLTAGDRVLDVGCGCGDTTIALARIVGPAGQVLGLDISEPMLARARARASEAGIGHARFQAADAQTERVDPASADVLFSRFGVMFFSDPTAAFTNLHTALATSGRLAFVCWQSIADNPWMLVPLRAAAAHVRMPPPPAPDAPGPFSFADPERVRRILVDAGFRDVAIAPFAPDLEVGGGGSLDDAVEFVMQLGPMGAVLRDADPAALPMVGAAVRDALAPYATARGVVMPSAAWVVTARS